MEQQSEHLLKLIEAYTNLVQEEKQIFFEYIYKQQKEQNQQLIINKQLKQQRTNYPIHIKKEVVKISLLHNNSTYAAQYMNKTYPEFHNIFRQNTISDWVKQFSTLQQKAASKKKKQQNRKQQQKYPLLEEKQSCEFQLARQNKLAINTLWFKIHMKKLVNENQVDLKCSQGWLYNFLKRYKIVKRTPTHYIQQKAKDLQQQIEQFLKDCLKHKYDIEKFGQVEGKNKIIYYNMDKTPLYFDMQLKSTYSFKGERQIIVKKTNHPKKRLKILLAINSEGDKLPPLLIFNKQKKQMTDFQMISQYVESKILKFKKIFLSNGLSKYYLIIRQVSNFKKFQFGINVQSTQKLHSNKLLLNFLQERYEKIQQIYFPVGCTGLLTVQFQEGVKQCYLSNNCLFKKILGKRN